MPTLPTSNLSRDRLAARFFGVTTVHFELEGTQILIDGFFSRPGLLQILAGRIKPDDERISKALTAGRVGTLSALFVAHSHYDHALDSARVVKRNGGVLMGSESTANLGRAEGLPANRIKVIQGGESFSFGGFDVTAYQSPHSPDALFEGGITAPLYPPARVSDYKEGGNFSFLIRTKNCSILVHPSANYLPGLFEGVQADVVFLSIGKLGEQGDVFIRTYWAETIGRTNPRLVILTHWDDFFKPLDGRLTPMPVPLDRISKAIRAIAGLADRETTVAVMPLYEPVDIMSATGGCNGGNLPK